MECICSDCQSVQKTERYLSSDNARMLEFNGCFMDDLEIDSLYDTVVDQHEYLGQTCVGSWSIPEAVLLD